MSIISNEKIVKAPVSFYDLKAPANDGTLVSFNTFRGKKVLIVNLASKCGFTPQYDDLERLQQLYKDKITILGFPSDDFGGQEPGSDQEIAEFCRLNFGVTFQLFHKDHVKGLEKQPVYGWLTEALNNGWNKDEPTWNFCKYMLNESGDLMHFFSSAVSPLDDGITGNL